VLLKVVLCAYARGIVSSRTIARLCEDHATFIALCGACRPHFTTIAAFVSGLGVDKRTSSPRCWRRASSRA
jgi:transposase